MINKIENKNNNNPNEEIQIMEFNEENRVLATLMNELFKAGAVKASSYMPKKDSKSKLDNVLSNTAENKNGSQKNTIKYVLGATHVSFDGGKNFHNPLILLLESPVGEEEKYTKLMEIFSDFSEQEFIDLLQSSVVPLNQEIKEPLHLMKYIFAYNVDLLPVIQNVFKEKYNKELPLDLFNHFADISRFVDQVNVTSMSFVSEIIEATGKKYIIDAHFNIGKENQYIGSNSRKVMVEVNGSFVKEFLDTQKERVEKMTDIKESDAVKDQVAALKESDAVKDQVAAFFGSLQLMGVKIEQSVMHAINGFLVPKVLENYVVVDSDKIIEQIKEGKISVSKAIYENKLNPEKLEEMLLQDTTTDDQFKKIFKEMLESGVKPNWSFLKTVFSSTKYSNKAQDVILPFVVSEIDKGNKVNYELCIALIVLEETSELKKDKYKKVINYLEENFLECIESGRSTRVKRLLDVIYETKGKEVFNKLIQQHLDSILHHSFDPLAGNGAKISGSQMLQIMNVGNTGESLLKYIVYNKLFKNLSKEDKELFAKAMQNNIKALTLKNIADLVSNGIYIFDADIAKTVSESFKKIDLLYTFNSNIENIKNFLYHIKKEDFDKIDIVGLPKHMQFVAEFIREGAGRLGASYESVVASGGNIGEIDAKEFAAFGFHLIDQNCKVRFVNVVMDELYDVKAIKFKSDKNKSLFKKIMEGEPEFVLIAVKQGKISIEAAFEVYPSSFANMLGKNTEFDKSVAEAICKVDKEKCVQKISLHNLPQFVEVLQMLLKNPNLEDKQKQILNQTSQFAESEIQKLVEKNKAEQSTFSEHEGRSRSRNVNNNNFEQRVPLIGNVSSNAENVNNNNAEQKSSKEKSSKEKFNPINWFSNKIDKLKSMNPTGTVQNAEVKNAYSKDEKREK